MRSGCKITNCEQTFKSLFSKVYTIYGYTDINTEGNGRETCRPAFLLHSGNIFVPQGTSISTDAAIKTNVYKTVNKNHN